MNRAAEIEAQAALWIARCDAQASGYQSPELIAWLSADARHRAAYLRLSEAWHRSERLERLRPNDGLIDPDLLAPPGRPKLWRTVRLRLRRSPTADAASGLSRSATPYSSHRAGRRAPTRSGMSNMSGVAARPRLRALGWAAGAALAAGLLWWNLAPSATHIYRTGAAGLSRVLLADGSEMTLNSDTEVQARFTTARRSLILTRGEAQFAVMHDLHRPFEVEASNRVVVAVGTAFDVRLEDNHAVEVTVTEGRVAIMRPDLAGPKLMMIPPPIISAGESALATSDRITVQRILPAQISSRLAWEHRELTFQGQPLSEAVAEFNHYNGHRLVIDDPALESLQIGGTFEALDIASFAAALQRSFKISVRVADNGTVHLFSNASQGESPPTPR